MNFATCFKGHQDSYSIVMHQLHTIFLEYDLFNPCYFVLFLNFSMIRRMDANGEKNICIFMNESVQDLYRTPLC